MIRVAGKALKDRSFDVITEVCSEAFNSADEFDPIEAAERVMDDANFPMHNFAHHYLVPALLLTSVCRTKGVGAEAYGKMMKTAEERSLNVLPAFCGLYGACGAAVGCGVFMSVFTGATPLSKERWALCNGATAGALQKMADLGGPRCCKRMTFTALQFMKDYIAEHLGAEVAMPDKIRCKYDRFNLECLKDECPYHCEENGA